MRLTQEHAVYAAMVEAMDLAVGKVLAKLDELGLRENTIVIFTSDNGGSRPVKAGRLRTCHCEAAKAGCTKAASASHCLCAGPLS